MVNADGRLAIAELVIYIIIFPIGVYLLFRHGRQGLIGWGFFLIFCTLRLVSSGIQISGTTITGAIINSVGISALLLAISGVIHEASTYESNHRPKIGHIIQLLLHILITSGIAISAVGQSQLQTAPPDQVSTYRGLQEGGSLLLLFAILLLAIMAFMTIRKLQATSLNSRRSSAEPAGTLTIGAIVALHFAAVRVIYSVVYSFSHSTTLNPITGSFYVKLFLISIVQICASLALIAGGVSSRNIKQERSVERRESGQGFEGLRERAKERV